MYKKIGSNFSLLLGERLVRLLLGFYVWALIANNLAPDNFGSLNLVLAVNAIFLSVASLGMENTLLLDLSLRKNVVTIFSSAFFLRFFASVLVSAVSIISFYIEYGSDSQIFKFNLFVAVVIILQSLDVFEYYLQSIYRVKISTAVKMICFTLASVYRIYLSKNNSDLLGYGYAYFLEYFLQYSLYAYLALRTNRLISLLAIDKKYILSILKRSFPYVISGFAIMSYMKFDQIYIVDLISSDALGRYVAATKLSEIWYFIGMALASSFSPMLSQAKHDKHKFNMIYEKYLKIAIILSLILVAMIQIFANEIMGIVYTHKYDDVVDVLRIVSINIPLVFVGIAGNIWLVNKESTVLFMYQSLSGLIANVILNMLLVQPFGLYGAAVASVLTQFICVFAINLLFEKSRELTRIQVKSLYSIIFFAR